MIEVVVGKSGGRTKRRKNTPEELRWEGMLVEEIATLASTPSMLGDSRTFILEGALTGELGEEFLALTEGLQKSPHTFVFQEEKLLKKPLDFLAKKSVTVEWLLEEKKEESFNVFSIAQAFALRDRKKMWLLLGEALRANVAPEALAGMLHWKVRDLLAKNAPGKFTQTELKTISRELVTLYHEAHKGGGSLDLLLERFVLKV